MKRLKKASKHEVTLISATTISSTAQDDHAMYQANSAIDPSSKVLVPAPPKGLPPPKPVDSPIRPDSIDFSSQSRAADLPSPCRPAPSLPTINSPKNNRLAPGAPTPPKKSPSQDRKNSFPASSPLVPRQDGNNSVLQPSRPAPLAPPELQQKYTYKRSLTEPMAEIRKDKAKGISLKKSSSDRHNTNNRLSSDAEAFSNQDIINILENKKNIKLPPPVKPKPQKNSTSRLESLNSDDQQKSATFIDVGDGLRSSDSESLCSDKFTVEAADESKENIAPEQDGHACENLTMRKSESSSSQGSEEPYDAHSGKGKNALRPLSFPNNKNPEKSKHRKVKSMSFRRKRQSPPGSPAPPPLSSPLDVDALLGFNTISQEESKTIYEKSTPIQTPPPKQRQRSCSTSPVDDFIGASHHITGPRCLVAHSHLGAGDDELTLNKGDMVFLVQHINNEWIYGNLNGKNGLIHKQNVLIIEDLPKRVPHSNIDETKNKMIARYDFTARNDKEMSLSFGDILVNCKKVAEHWLYGEKVTHKGLFPITYADSIHA